MIDLIRPVIKYAPRRFLLSMGSLFTLQAVLGAAGTAALALAGRHFADPRTFALYVGAYLTLALAPNAVVALIRWTEMRGYLEMYRAFLNERFTTYRGQPARWANRRHRERFLTAIGSEAEQYLGILAYSVLDLYAFALQIVLNAVALAATVDASFAWTLVASVAFSASVFALRRRAIERAIEPEQHARIDLGAYVLRAWDNVLLNNWSVRERYMGTLDAKITATRDLAGRAAFRGEFTVFLLNVASSLPVYLTIAYVLWRDSAQPAALIALLATVPRQIDTLKSFRFFFQQLNNARIFGVRLRAAIANSVLDEVDLTALITIEKITVDGHAATSVGDALNGLKIASRGRFVIRGENGAGKSSLLLALHAARPDSFYLPATADLEVGDSGRDESTGQRLLRYLRAATDHGALLLDEWDANLDPGNRAAIERRLDHLSLTRAIIEVRHHQRSSRDWASFAK